MASVFKKSRDKGKKNKPYWVEYRDADGSRAYVKGFTDKGLTEQLGARLENEAMLRRMGLIDPDQERLAKGRQISVEEALQAFDRSLENTTEKHRKLTMTRVRRLIEGTGVQSIGNLQAETIENVLKALRKSDNLGARTYNHYLQAIDEFGKWLVSSKRLSANPVAGIARLNAETDVRHRRRALSPEEVGRLVASARSSGITIQGYEGELRARVYLISFLTGLRRSEIASLTPSSFDLNSDRPTLKVEAACSKHRREDTLPIHPDLQIMLREWIEGMDQEEPLFPRLDRKKTWLMVKLDLERCGIPYETSEGVADFHAAGRHSHVTGLLRNGASLVQTKELARHADVRMTMRYAHIGLEDQAEALSGLPLPNASTNVDWSGIGREPGDFSSHEPAQPVTTEESGQKTDNAETPSDEGVSTSVVTSCREASFDVSSGGGGNCTRVPRPIRQGVYVCVPFFGFRRAVPNRQGPAPLIQSFYLARDATGG